MATLRAKKRFGQHFLHDGQIIQQIAQALSVPDAACLVEIGPGRGALTQVLAQMRSHLDVIELDRDLIAFLQQCPYADKLTIHAGDVLNFDFNTLNPKHETHALHVIGNLPYNISTPLLFHLSQYAEQISQMVFMLQKEVVMRLCAEPNSKNYGRLSVLSQYHYQMDYLFDVPPEAFSPPPKVDSAVIRLQPHDQPVVDIDFARLKKVVDLSFAQRRKTLHNNLKKHVKPEVFELVNIDPKVRAETLSLEDFAALARHFPK